MSLSGSSACGVEGPPGRLLSSSTIASARRMSRLRSSRSLSPSLIEKPSHSASTTGAATTSNTTSVRSRGEMRSQNSRTRSATAMTTSHALSDDVELELLDPVLLGRGRPAVDLLEALDRLQLALQQIELLRSLDGALEVDLLIGDVDPVDVERDLLLGRRLARDLEQDVVGRHLRQRRGRDPGARGGQVEDLLVGLRRLEVLGALGGQPRRQRLLGLAQPVEVRERAHHRERRDREHGATER